MIEFNSDGSIKLPSNISEEKNKKDNRIKNTRCAQVRKEAVSTYAPKKCVLHVELSEKITDPKYIEQAFNNFKDNSETPIKIKKVEDRLYAIEIGSSFRRCSECTSVIRRLRDILDGNVIVDKGSCTLKEREFNYEDHFE